MLMIDAFILMYKMSPAAVSLDNCGKHDKEHSSSSSKTAVNEMSLKIKTEKNMFKSNMEIQ